MSFSRSNRLLGWDYVDLIDFTDFPARKSLELAHQCWPLIFSREPGVMVLFCGNLQPAIRPSLASTLCSGCMEIPAGLGVLVASDRFASRLGMDIQPFDTEHGAHEELCETPFQSCWDNHRGLRSRCQCCNVKAASKDVVPRSLETYQNGASLIGGARTRNALSDHCQTADSSTRAASSTVAGQKRRRIFEIKLPKNAEKRRETSSCAPSTSLTLVDQDHGQPSHCAPLRNSYRTERI